jgi:hypothetical protein
VVTAPPAVVVAREREDAMVRCTITGVPRPLVSWYKNAELITPSEYFQVLGYLMGYWGNGWGTGVVGGVLGYLVGYWGNW